MVIENGDTLLSPREYALQSRHYLENSQSAIELGELEKAGEFLWGSMALAIKAVAAFKGIELRSHRLLWDYAKEVSRDLREESIFTAFRDANSLHSNFYETGMSLDILLDSEERIRHAVGNLISKIPPEVLEQ